jgi:hypothetical protein
MDLLLSNQARLSDMYTPHTAAACTLAYNACAYMLKVLYVDSNTYGMAEAEKRWAGAISKINLAFDEWDECVRTCNWLDNVYKMHNRGMILFVGGLGAIAEAKSMCARWFPDEVM